MDSNSAFSITQAWNSSPRHGRSTHHGGDRCNLDGAVVKVRDVAGAAICKDVDGAEDQPLIFGIHFIEDDRWLSIRCASQKSLMYSIIPFPSFEPMPPRHGAGYLIYLYRNIIIAATAQQSCRMVVFQNQIIKLNRYVLESFGISSAEKKSTD